MCLEESPEKLNTNNSQNYTWKSYPVLRKSIHMAPEKKINEQRSKS